MDNIQQTTPAVVADRSDLSDFAGPLVTALPPVSDSMRLGQDKVAADYMDYALRAYDLLQEGYGITSLSYGPASAPTLEFSLLALMANSDTFKEMFKFFDGVAYDKVSYRITCSAPKGLAGGFFCGVYPYQPWGDANISAYYASHDLNHMTRQHLTLSPNSHLMCYGDATDVSIQVPWQHNCDYLTRHYVMNSSLGASDQFWPGTPILWFLDAGSYFLSTQSIPAKIRVFVKFENLRFVAPSVLQQGLIGSLDPQEPEEEDWMQADGPIQALVMLMEALGMPTDEQLDAYEEYYDTDSDYEHQSGLEVPIAAAAVVGDEILSALTRAMKETFTDSEKPSSYEKPDAVQLAYVGDSTSTGSPPTQPIFHAFGQEGSRHEVSSFITQPQWIETITTQSSSIVYYGNPTAPRGVPNVNGPDQCCTYLRFFSQMSSYWRGTLYFDFVVMGHPMVEVEYKLKILYPPWSEITTETYSQNSILQGLCSGVYTISVPMPFMTPKDHMEIVDSTILGDTQIRIYSSSLVSVDFDVVSTALDAVPIIPVCVFLRAGDDFHFLQPNPVGYSSVYEHQCNIPKPSKVFETRALDTPPTATMMPMEHVESYMTIWSRALPFGAYDDNDEPVVSLDFATSPYWYPMNDSAAARTLGTQNSWYVTNDYISLVSSMFLYFKGSLAFKILCLPSQSGYKYVSLSVGQLLRQLTHNPFTASPAQLPSKANFGYGTVATDLSAQPVLELTVPLRSTFEWAPSNPLSFDVVMGGWYRTPAMVGQLYHNVVLHVPSSDLQDALYRKIGPDFSLAVRGLLPPPTLWMAKGNSWS